MVVDHKRSCSTGLDDMPPANGLSRRGFLQIGAAAGGGFVLSLSLPLGKSGAAKAAFEPNAFIHIAGDGEIVLTMPYVEMGQGTYMRRAVVSAGK